MFVTDVIHIVIDILGVENLRIIFFIAYACFRKNKSYHHQYQNVW